ncbi:hypothetical protein [Fibrella forsythiae]|uniref:Nucleoside 2-deoxyribosyltransferase n=1 Tax=Fibrella forsythiae TaxID=2817061 RepID=A0ABS3JQA1_9BACT|nr:hypothetical protein [Fibrella forsythiae]MBO0951571.1 hypothetical protein [Fibrella forsythiae]
MKSEEKKQAAECEESTYKTAVKGTNGETDASATTKIAFFITPLGGDSSEIRRATDGIINAVIEPALKQFNIQLVPPHKIKNPGNITRQIVRYILECDLVIANLTGLNANVMYELAIRHARRKPVIVIAEIGTTLPFDIAAERTIFYKNDMGGAVELMARLIDTIPVALEDQNPENPVYSGLESSIIQEQIKEGGGSQLQAYVIDKLDQLTDSVASMRNNFDTQRTASMYATNNSARTMWAVTLKYPTYEKVEQAKKVINKYLPEAIIGTDTKGELILIGLSDTLESKSKVTSLYERLMNSGIAAESILPVG